MWHKNDDTLGLPNLCCVCLTILEVIDYTAVLLIRCWSVLDRGIDYTQIVVTSTMYAERTICIDIKQLQQLALHRLGLFYNLHLIDIQVYDTFLNEKCQTVVTP